MDIHNFIETLVNENKEISKQRKEEWIELIIVIILICNISYIDLYNNINISTYTTASDIIRSNITYRSKLLKKIKILR